MWPSNVAFTNELSISGIPASQLAHEFGTPAFIMDEADFRVRATKWNSALVSAFGENSGTVYYACLLYTSPSPRDGLLSRMPSSA